jgi:hypothetical protein
MFYNLCMVQHLCLTSLLSSGDPPRSEAPPYGEEGDAVSEIKKTASNGIASPVTIM